MEQEQHNTESTESREWMDSLLKGCRYLQLLRVTAFIIIFAANCRNRCRRDAPLTTEEIEAAEKFWQKFSQESHELVIVTELRQDSTGI